MRIVHLTSAHGRYDIRIFKKECTSLLDTGGEVFLIVADGGSDEIVGGIRILSSPKEDSRLRRMLFSPHRLFRRAVNLDADIYHIHDPELLPVGSRLIGCGKKVIFDAHEDLPKQILSKPYLGNWSRVLLSIVFAIYEKIILRRYTAIIGATPSISKKFSSWHPMVLTVNNYPILGELDTVTIAKPSQPLVCYIGSVSYIRGAAEMVDAIGRSATGARLEIAGPFSPTRLEAELASHPSWGRVDVLGQLSRTEVADLLSRSAVGLVVFQAEPNHLESQPNKLFEYMSAGLPLIVSDFPLWKALIEEVGCGICVDPANPQAIATAIDWIVRHPIEAREMGSRGKDAVLDKYNWRSEGLLLLDLYSKCLAK